MRPPNNLGNNSGNNSGNYARQNVVREFVARAFGWIVALWPADLREWAQAMQAELGEIESTRESLQWLAGGMMSLGKAWWNEVIYGWKDGEEEPRRVQTPGPVALALAVVALAAFFLWPSTHEGFSAMLQSWPTNPRGASAGVMCDVAKQARSNHDARALIFTAGYNGTTEDAAQAMDEAVAIDPSLTWIYVHGASSGYSYYGIPEKHGWVKKLEAWDPSNAAPYLVEAAVRQQELWNEAKGLPAKGVIVNDPAWRAAMEKAFAAPRVDFYLDREDELNRAVLRKYNLHGPTFVFSSLVRIYPFGLWSSGLYSEFLIGQAKDAQQNGDTAAAARAAWAVVQFAERLRQNTDVEVVRRIVDTMLLSAYEVLQPLEVAAGHTGSANTLSIEKEILIRRKASRKMPYLPWTVRSLNPTGISFHIAGLGILLFGGALLFSALYLLAGRFPTGLRAKRAYRWACTFGRFTPAGLLASVVLLSSAYAPYLRGVNLYLAGAKDAPTSQELLGMTESFSQLPGEILGPMHQGQDRVYFWEGLLVALLAIGALSVIRFAFTRRREPRMKAA